jgi:hypothetical protein
MTSLSLNDIITQGSQIGFYPDNAYSFEYTTALGTTNNNNFTAAPVVSGALNSFDTTNSGLLRRQQAWNFNPKGLLSTGGAQYSTLLSAANMQLLWKSYIFNTTNASVATPTTTAGVWQVAITAQIFLKHLHSFFERVPLLKGVFMKLTLNLNQTSISFTSTGAGTALTNMVVNSPLGGVSPLMLASTTQANAGGVACFVAGNYIASLSVGGTCLNTTQNSLGNIVQNSPLGRSILLNVPAYTFAPVFETSYLSSPIKKIVYTDIYQYQIVNQITAGQTYNQLITNGIANIKTVACFPYFQASANGGISPLLSPYDPAGAGTTSPLALQTQFNIQVSGQNSIYNTVRYSYEQFLNQVYGINAVNSGMTDGLTSGLIGQSDFEMEYCYYVVNVGRCLAVEETVPKSVNILGTNMSGKAIDMFVFIEYGVEVSVDILTGARV